MSALTTGADLRRAPDLSHAVQAACDDNYHANYNDNYNYYYYNNYNNYAQSAY